MTSEEIRTRFLNDHMELRGKAAVLESLALHVLRGDRDLASALRLKGEELQSHLLRHMRWEETLVLPLLPEVTGGSYTSADFLEEHQRQRETLAESLVALKDHQQGPHELAGVLLEFVRWLERDMAAEEANVLTILDLGPSTAPADED